MAKINVEGIGDIDIPDQSMWATEETLALIAAKLRALPAQTNKDNKNTAESNRQIRFFNRHMYDTNVSLRITRAAFDTLAKAIDGSMGIVRGIMNVTGNLSDLNFAIDGGVNAITRFTDMVPIVGNFISSLIEARAEVFKMQLAFADLTATTFSDLSRAGVDVNENVDQMISAFIATGAGLENMKKIVSDNNDTLTRLGGTAEQGITQFTANIDSLTDQNSPLGIGLRFLGLNAETIAEAMSDFYQINRRNVEFTRLTGPQLNQQLSQRIRNERILTELTGIQVDEQRKEAMQIATNAAVQAAMLGMDSGIRSELTNLFSGLDPIARQFTEEVLVFKGPVNEVTGQFAALAPDIAQQLTEAVLAIEQGAPSAQYIAKIQDAYATSTNDLADLAKLTAISGTNLDSMSEIFLRSLDAATQLESLIGLGYSSFEDFTNELVLLQKDQQDKIRSITSDPDFKNLTDKEKLQRLTEVTENEKLANAIINRMKVEQAGADAQQQIFDGLIGNFESLANITATLTEALGDYATAVVGTANEPGKAITSVGSKIVNKLGEGTKLRSQEEIDADKEMVKGFLNKYILGHKSQIGNKFMGGQLFPGMLSMVGELGPELISMGNSMGEVINDKTTSDIMGAAQGIVQALKADVGAGGDLMSGTGLSKTMSAIESSAPMLESSMAKLGGDMQQQSVDLLTRIANDNADIKKLMNRILPKAMSGNGYF